MSYHSNNSSTPSSGGDNSIPQNTVSNSGDSNTTSSNSTSFSNTTISAENSLNTNTVYSPTSNQLNNNTIIYTASDVYINLSGQPEHYIFTDSSGAQQNDPDITIELGDTLIINNSTGGHPIEIKETVSGNIITTEEFSTNKLEFTPLVPGVGYYTYYCTSHPERMWGLINVISSAEQLEQKTFSLIPKLSGKGKLGTDSHPWSECHINSAYFKSLQLDRDLQINGSAFCSSFIADDLFINESAQYASGALCYMGETNPSNAEVGNLEPHNQNSENLHVTFDGKFFAHNIYGDISIKEPGVSWRKLKADGLFSSDYSATTRIISTKLSDGTAKLYAQVASVGNEFSTAGFSSDYGSTWSPSTSEPSGYFHGGPNKSTQAGWSVDISSSDNLMHVFGNETISIGSVTRTLNYTLSNNVASNAYVFTLNSVPVENPEITDIIVYDKLVFNNTIEGTQPFEIVDTSGEVVASSDAFGVTRFTPETVGTYTYRSTNSANYTGTITVSEGLPPVSTFDELARDYSEGDADIYASNTSNLLSGVNIFSQSIDGDLIWDLDAGSQAYSISLTPEQCKQFNFVIEQSWVGASSQKDSFGFSAGTAAVLKYPQIVCDSKHDIIFASLTTNPETNTVYAFFRGANKLLKEKLLQGSISSTFNQSLPNNSLIAYLTTSFPLVDTNYRFEPGASNDYLVYIGHSLVPTSLWAEDSIISEAFPKCKNFETSGVKIFDMNDFRKYGKHYQNLRDFKYLNDHTFSCVDVKTGELYTLDAQAASSALTLSNIDGSDWAEKSEQLLNSIKPYRNKVFINGIETPLDSGEEGNENFSAVQNVGYYLHDHSNGFVVGIGNKGWASERNLSSLNFESLNNVWKNTTSNGFTAPYFSGFSAYHSSSNSLTCSFQSVSSYSVESVSSDINNVWGKGRFSKTFPSYEIDFPFNDYATKLYSYSYGDTHGIYAATSDGWNPLSNIEIASNTFVGTDKPSSTEYNTRKGYGRTLPGHKLDHLLPQLQGRLQPLITLEDGSLLYTSYGVTNGNNFNTEFWPKDTHLALYRFSDDTLTNLLQSRVVSYSGQSSGHAYSYSGSAFTLNNNLTLNIYRDDFSSHSYQLQMFCFPGTIDLDTLPDLEEKLFDTTDHSSRQTGVFYNGEHCNIVFTDFDDLDPIDGRWSKTLVCRHDHDVHFLTSDKITTNFSSDRSMFSFSFDLPSASDGLISKLLNNIGLNDDKINQLTTKLDQSIDLREIELWVTLTRFDSNDKIVEEYKKLIRFRDGLSTDWPDEPLEWESGKVLSSAGDLGFVFTDNLDESFCHQMPNLDVIVGSGTSWRVGPVGALSGANSLFLDDPSWFTLASSPSMFGKVEVDTNDSFGGSYYPEQILCALSENSVLCLMSSRADKVLAQITTDGSGNFISTAEVYGPEGNTANSNIKFFASNDTVYYIEDDKAWYTSGSSILSSISSGETLINPDWTQINPDLIQLNSIRGVAHHPGSGYFYLLGNDGLYARSSSGVDNWTLDLNPQYTFSGDPRTGLHRDLNSDLHLIHSGQSILKLNNNGASSESYIVESRNSKPDNYDNKLYNINGSLYWGESKLASSGNKVVDGNLEINNPVEFNVIPGTTIHINFHFAGIVEAINLAVFGKFEVSTSNSSKEYIFADLTDVDVTSKFLINPSFSTSINVPNNSDVLTIQGLVTNILPMGSGLHVTAEYR
jgi:plastocyanin